MTRKSLLIFTTMLLVFTMLVGCGTKVPFERNPESEIKIEAMEKTIQNAEEEMQLYKDYFQYRVLNAAPEGFEDKMAALPEDVLEEKVTNGEKLVIINMLFEGATEEAEQLVLEEIQNYLKASRMDEQGLDFVLSPEFEKAQPIEKVQKYMKDNKIEVTQLLLSNSFEEQNTWVYPMKFTYKYTVVGTINGKAFEREIVQDFYIGADSEDLQERIEYIQ